jgi:hypothetical protein
LIRVLLAQAHEQLGIKDLSVVGQQPLNAKPETAIVGQGVMQEAGSTIGALSRPHFGESDSGMIIDGNVGHIVGHAAGAMTALTGDGWPLPRIPPKRLISMCRSSPGDARS